MEQKEAEELQPEGKFQQNTVVIGRGSLNRRDAISSLAERVSTGKLCGNKVFVSREMSENNIRHLEFSSDALQG